MAKKYRNKAVINQRGASIVINNTTDEESLQLSQRSGSNILLNNLVNSELATNNKQTLVSNDEFKTVGNDYTEYVAGDKNQRTAENTYDLKGFSNKSQIDAFNVWKETFRPIANLNSKFKIKRGGGSLPNGVDTELIGNRVSNPTLKNIIFSVENSFNGYTGLSKRTSTLDEVATYKYVPDKNKTKPATERTINSSNIFKSAGVDIGSSAPGVLEFGAMASSSTEGGSWESDNEASNIGDKVLELQDTLTAIEQQMGNGGDENIFVKRNKIETVGASFNDFPSMRVDLKGRSQPVEMLVSDVGSFKNHDYIPYVEEIDNSSNFPCGQDTKIIGNSYNRTVGSGGVSIKTTGSMELGGSTLKVGFKKIDINANYGVVIGSESSVEIQSLKTITLRTNRQVYVESSLGVKNNLIVGGGLYVEGEVYAHHITAPLEVQQTENTIVSGKFATDTDRTLWIGECQIGGEYFPVYARSANDLIAMYPHSHHFNNAAMTLTKSNSELRKLAQINRINNHDTIAQAIPQSHEKKLPTVVV